MLRNGCLSAGNYTIKGLASTPVYTVGGAGVLSGYGAFVVVILLNTCYYQCYSDTHTEINRLDLQQICVNCLKRIMQYI